MTNPVFVLHSCAALNTSTPTPKHTLEATVGVDEHLGVPVNTLIKLFVRNLGVVDVDLVRHDEAGLGSARNDQVAKVAVVGLDIALAGSKGETLVEG